MASISREWNINSAIRFVWICRPVGVHIYCIGICVIISSLWRGCLPKRQSRNHSCQSYMCVCVPLALDFYVNSLRVGITTLITPPYYQHDIVQARTIMKIRLLFRFDNFGSMIHIFAYTTSFVRQPHTFPRRTKKTPKINQNKKGIHSDTHFWGKRRMFHNIYVNSVPSLCRINYISHQWLLVHMILHFMSNSAMTLSKLLSKVGVVPSSNGRLHFIAEYIVMR